MGFGNPFNHAVKAESSQLIRHAALRELVNGLARKAARLLRRSRLENPVGSRSKTSSAFQIACAIAKPRLARSTRRSVGDSAVSNIPKSARLDVHENISDLGQLRPNMSAYIGCDVV